MREPTGGAVLPEYMSASHLQPFISKELREKFAGAVSYESLAGVPSTGVDVTVLPDICDVYIQAEKAGINNQNVLEASRVANQDSRFENSPNTISAAENPKKKENHSIFFKFWDLVSNNKIVSGITLAVILYLIKQWFGITL